MTDRCKTREKSIANIWTTITQSDYSPLPEQAPAPPARHIPQPAVPLSAMIGPLPVVKTAFELKQERLLQERLLEIENKQKLQRMLKRRIYNG